MCPVIKMNKLVSIIVATSALTLITATVALAQSPSPSRLVEAGAPSLSIISPAEGQTVYTDKVPVLISTENFQFVDYQVNTTKVAGQGHVHLWLDDQNPTPQSAVKVAGDSYTFQDVAYGDHKLVAELVSSDHTPLSPPVTVTVNFKTTPAPTPSAVATSGFDKNTAIVILVVVALVIAAAWWYTKEDEVETPAVTRKPTKKTAAKSRRK